MSDGAEEGTASSEPETDDAAVAGDGIGVPGSLDPASLLEQVVPPLVAFAAIGLGMGLVATTLIGTFTSAAGSGATVIRQVVTVIDVIVLGLTGPVVAGLHGLQLDDPGVVGAGVAAAVGAVGHFVLYTLGALVVVLLLGGGIGLTQYAFPAIVGMIGAAIAGGGTALGSGVVGHAEAVVG